MASERAPDAMTAEELADNDASGLSIESPSPKLPNAFTRLMAHSKQAKSNRNSTPGTSSLTQIKKPALSKRDPRSGLGIYIEKPESNPEGLVVEYDDDFVVINDKFPKASVHLLLIPRNPAYYNQHPLHILSTDATFRSQVQERMERLKTLAACELRRQFGHLSISDAPYQTALETLMTSPHPPSTEERDALLPQGRDWSSEIVAGVHTHPSMSHLHIHVFSRDMHSPSLKHKKHYLSFNSSFLVRMAEFPLCDGSERFRPADWSSWDMKCWRCGANFRNKFAALKGHLEGEFEEWARE